LFSGSYVAIAYGTNDAGFCCDARVSPTIFYNNYASMVQAVIASGKTPIIPKIPWGCTSQILTYAPQLNQQLDALYTAFPQIVRGPDLWAFFNANQSLIGPDCIHPTAAGYTALRQQWVNTAVAAVYTPPPALQISNVQTSSVGSSSAVITWTTNNSASSQVDYGTTTAYGSNVADTATVTSHSVTLTGLTPNTTYHYQVSGTDTFGQNAASPDATFTTTIVVGPASHFALATTATPTAGTPFSFTLTTPKTAAALTPFPVTVTLTDAYGNMATGYRGTVHFKSTDPLATLPPDTTFTAADGGRRQFNVTLATPPGQTISVYDIANSSL